MSDKLQILWDLAMPFPITPRCRQQAKDYAEQYLASITQREIYLHTLSLLVANAYFRLLNFQTDLGMAKRWNAAFRLWSSATELELGELGKIECRAISAAQKSVVLPPEAVYGDRIGYLFIEINDSEKMARLLGFLPASPDQVDPVEVLLEDLMSMDEMIDYLAELESCCVNEVVTVDELSQEFAAQKLIYLKNWLNNVYTDGWQPVMRKLNTTTGQKIISLAGQMFDLQIAMSIDGNESTLIRLNVRSVAGLLPKGMMVLVPDEEEVYAETVSEPVDLVTIPMEFPKGATFWVELRLEEDFIREYFVN
jgi:hypothetical protein